ncbi:MAG: hypothetical protein KGI64_09210 [Xanthomonadaceae bacterium]|nr:hypothetical protein [Xanthomonadaceae bacterium]MDE2085025.1 hypothetical protein [Xanthomonadaceae bacterium]
MKVRKVVRVYWDRKAYLPVGHQLTEDEARANLESFTNELIRSVADEGLSCDVSSSQVDPMQFEVIVKLEFDGQYAQAIEQVFAKCLRSLQLLGPWR